MLEGTPVEERPAFLLAQLGAHTRLRFTDRLAPLGLQPRHFGALEHIANQDGSTQQEIADLMQLPRGAMVGLLDDLEAMGLVERRKHPDDRRANALHLTPTARRQLTRARRAADQLDAELLNGLPEHDRAQLVPLLQRLAAGVGLSAGIHPDLQAPAPHA
jgi:DNA-binding MarR family transcriptional regulator